MVFTAQNEAYNMTVSDAQAFKAKLAALGIYSGNLHANGHAVGEQADYVDVAEAGLPEVGKYDIVARINGGWHNMSMLKKEFGAGSIEEFKRVCADCKMDPDSTLLNIPGAAAAITALIAKA
jgi:hypothetical protein